jgi:para-aminobenzoate synthetase component 1
MTLAIDHILQAAGRVTEIRTREIAGPMALMEWAARLADQEGTVLLMSGGEPESARYDILGFDPWLQLKGRGHQLTLTVDQAAHQLIMDPMDALRAVLTHHGRPRKDASGTPPAAEPLSSGLMGYLSYDLKDVLEALPRTSLDRWQLPHLCFYAPAIIVVHDRHSGQTLQHDIVRRKDDAPLAPPARDRLAAIADAPPPDGRFSVDPLGLRSNFDRAGYESAVRRIRDYIAAGDVYQVNLSQRFETRFEGSAFGFFQALYEKNPAPFFAYLNAGDHQVVSTSPERFLRLARRQVETRPIKGTRPRGRTPEEDRSLREELAASAKDDAELSMIVDLLRNDIGRVCRGGSVRVRAHKRLEAYTNVYHLVSIVEGLLAEGRDAVDLIRAAFPGGSITGCPKIRSMEIIDELEPDRRHIYTGSIGYIGFQETMDLSIAIRTAVIHQNRLAFSVGGGIVYDSDPSDEYAETLHKGRTLVDVCAECAPLETAEEAVWFDGRICPAGEARLPVTGPGVRHGDGFFETMRAERGSLPLLARHKTRWEKSWGELMEGSLPDISWEAVIAQVLAHNGLGDALAAVRLTVSRGRPAEAPGYHLFVTARSYRHRLAALGIDGLRLATYPEPRQTPLADHKTLNYLFYRRAGRWAREKGAHEALIINPDGTLSETNTANLLLVQGRTVHRPQSTHVLPGVMEACVLEQLAAMGYRIRQRPLYPSELYAADQVLLTNALMGCVPAGMLDGAPLAEPDGFAATLNRRIFGEGAAGAATPGVSR